MATVSDFKRQYVKAIQEGYAAIFAGAGLSRPSGFVNWKELLRELAEEIHLDVDKETDLVEVAQYYCNEKRGRSELNAKILNRFITESQENSRSQCRPFQPEQELPHIPCGHLHRSLGYHSESDLVCTGFRFHRKD